LELCVASLDQIFLEPENPRKYKGPELPNHLEIFLQLAEGLEYIHSKNLFHRDIKPANVLISTDDQQKVTMKLADFGLSKSVNERGTCSMNSGVKGTNNWLAPELLKSIANEEPQQGRGTVKSDVFALGLVFGYLLLKGEHLYGKRHEINENILDNKPVNMKSKFLLNE
jgi:serine/threonine protein kinase